MASTTDGTSGSWNVNLNNGAIGPTPTSVNPNFTLNSSNMLGLSPNLAPTNASGSIATYLPNYAGDTAQKVPAAALPIIAPTNYNTTGALPSQAVASVVNNANLHNAQTTSTPASTSTGSVSTGPSAPVAPGGVSFGGKMYYPGMAAPSGYSWNSQGNGFVPTNTLATTASSNVSPSATSSAVSGTPSTYDDVIKAINANLTAYQQTAQQNQDELNAQQQLIQSMQNAQNFRTNLTAGELAQYGVGRPLSLDTGRAAQMEFNNQINLQNLQNAQSIANQQYQNQIFNRQVRTQAAQGLLQGSLSEAGLVKPESLSPGSSLVSPTGAVAYQGSGLYPASVGDVANLANSLVQTGQAPDFQTAYGMALQALQSQYGTMGGGSSSTANQYGSNQGSSVPTYDSSTGNVLGYNLGTYAQDPSYSSSIAQTIANMPGGNTMYGPQGIQSYIDSQNSNASITGQMIYNASSSAGIDPRLLTAMIGKESNFGSSNVAIKNNNPGGIKFANQSNATPGTAAPGGADGGNYAHFLTMQDGLTSMAQEVASRYVGNSNQNFSPNMTMDRAQLFNNTRANLPSQVAPALGALTDGSLYFDQSKIPSAMSSYAQTYSAKSGIPILTTAEVENVRAGDNALTYLNQMKTVFSQIADSGLWGRIKGLTWNQATQFLETDPVYKQFNTFRDSAIRQIQAMAGGSGSGFRLNQSEIDTQTGILPTVSDNLESGMASINQIQSFLNEKLQSVLPNFDASALSSSSSNNASQDPLGIL